MRYTHDVQLVHFHDDQVEPRGPVDAEGARSPTQYRLHLREWYPVALFRRRSGEPVRRMLL